MISKRNALPRSQDMCASTLSTATPVMIFVDEGEGDDLLFGENSHSRAPEGISLWHRYGSLRGAGNDRIYGDTEVGEGVSDFLSLSDGNRNDVNNVRRRRRSTKAPPELRAQSMELIGDLHHRHHDCFHTYRRSTSAVPTVHGNFCVRILPQSDTSM